MQFSDNPARRPKSSFCHVIWLHQPKDQSLGGERILLASLVEIGKVYTYSPFTILLFTTIVLANQVGYCNFWIAPASNRFSTSYQTVLVCIGATLLPRCCIGLDLG